MAVGRIAGSLLVAAALALLSGCVTVAEFRKLETEVNRIKGEGATGSAARARPDLSAY